MDVKVHLPQGLVCLPPKLRLLHWDRYPMKCMPSNFRVECLVELTMINSKLEKLWEGDQPLESLKKMNLALSKKLKEIPNLSNAKKLENLDLCGCTSLVTLPSSVRNLNNLRKLRMDRCRKLEVLPNDVNLESLEYLNLKDCSMLKKFPRISKNLKRLFLDDTEIEGEEDCFWIENICGLTKLCWDGYPMRCMPSKFCPENLVELRMRGTKIEKLWEGVQPLGSLVRLDLSRSENLKAFPELSKATNLESLALNNCISLVMVPSSIGNLNKLIQLAMSECTSLELLPTNINLVSLNHLNLSGCSLLTNFPQLSTSLLNLNLDETAIEEVPSWIENISGLTSLTMRACKMLKNISANLFKLKRLKEIDFSDCEGVTTFIDATVVTTVGRITFDHMTCLKFHNCFNLDQEAEELILQSDFEYAVLPGEELPKYFTHRDSGSSLIIPLSQSSHVEEFVELLACIMLEPPTPSLDLEDRPIISPSSLSEIKVCWHIKGENRVHEVHVNMNSYEMDHLVMFHFGFPLTEVNDLEDKNVEFEFSCQALDLVFESSPCSCSRYGFHSETCRFSFKKIKGCGISYLDGSGTNSKTMRSNMRPVIKRTDSMDGDLAYYYISGKSDVET